MRNENGTGSIVCLDKTGKKRRKPWAVRVTIGWKDGKQLRKYVGYYKTQKEALIALAEYHNNNVNLDLSKLTLQELFDRWLVRIENKHLSPTVVTTHKMAAKRFGVLGNKQFKSLKTDHLQDWLDSLDLKPGSKIKAKHTLSQMYEYAISNDIVNKNYAKSLEIPEKIEKVGAVFTDEELKTLWEHADEPNIQDILILIYTGMRIGELLILTKDDINFDEGYAIGGIKTDNGKNRVIPFHERILPFIKAKTENSKYIVHSAYGSPIKYATAKQRFQKVMTRFGWSHNLHDTRKTGVSLMHSAGIPMETVRMIAGHSGKGVTEAVYLYKQPKELVDTINTMKIPY